MIFMETPLLGAYTIDIEKLSDERGFFARTFCREEFKKKGLNPNVIQCNISFNLRRGTLRGMHIQKAPKAEAKLVRCSRGALYDVIIDLRSNSPTYCKWFATELTSESFRMFYIPEGFAHGFQTLTDNTEVLYQMSESYSAEQATGVRWDDPAFSIQWPLSITEISLKDSSYPDFSK